MKLARLLLVLLTLITAAPVGAEEIGDSADPALLVSLARDKAISLDQTRSVESVGEANAVTPNCVPLPLPTVPSGPSWTREKQTSSTERVQITVWRVPCGGSNAQTLVTFTPLAGSPFVCSSEAYVIQNSTQANALYDTNPNNSLSDSFCGDVFVPTTAALTDSSSTFDLNDDGAFTLVITGISSLGGDITLSIPAYDPAQYGQTSGPRTLAGKLSGSYFDPARSGEGILLEIGQVGTRKVFQVSWYTYFQGAQRWIFGNVDFTAGATSVTVPLIITGGTGFGTDFNPAQLAITPWGSATFQFPTCSTMTFTWSNTAGQSGTYNYQRLVDGLEGISCP